MRHSLEFKTEQRLALTPQIRQSLRLLQMSSHSLDLEIKNRVENNPILELEPMDYYIDQVRHPLDHSNDYSDTQFVNSKNQIDESHYMMESEGIESFEEHLFKQVKLSHANTQQQLMIAFLIEFLDERGYLTESLEEINHLWHENDLPFIEATEDWRLALKFLQSFEPTGVGAQNLSECLVLQLTARKENKTQKLLEPINLAIKICEQGLEFLSKADYQKLQELTQADYAQIKEAQLLIQACDPSPAHFFNIDTVQMIVPDVILLKEKEHWQVKINPYIRTNLIINKDYLELIENNKDNPKFFSLEKKLQEAQVFIKQVQHRFSTILAVAQMIMQHQMDFIEQGDLGIKPLTLKMIAKKLNLHESTISRATKNKYIATPLGSYELSYFFSSKLATKAQYEGASARQAQALIKEWINNEAQDKPYSDSQLVNLLEQQDIVLARRTVAKYRQQLGIAAKSARKARYRLQAD